MRLEDLAPMGISFVIVAIVLSIGVDITQTLEGTNVTLNTTTQDVYRNGTAGLGELASWLPTIGLVLAAAVVIGIVVSYFTFGNRN